MILLCSLSIIWLVFGIFNFFSFTFASPASDLKCLAMEVAGLLASVKRHDGFDAAGAQVFKIRTFSISAMIFILRKKGKNTREMCFGCGPPSASACASTSAECKHKSGPIVSGRECKKAKCFKMTLNDEWSRLQCGRFNARCRSVWLNGILK